MKKLCINILFAAVIIALSGCAILADKKQLKKGVYYKLYFMQFDTETYFPVTKADIEENIFEDDFELEFYYCDNEFCTYLKQVFEAVPTDSKIDESVIRLKFIDKGHNLVYYVDYDGIVERSDKKTFKLDKAVMDEITKKSYSLFGVVDCQPIHPCYSSWAD